MFLDEMIGLFNNLAAFESELTRQQECAVGMWTDDPAIPGVTAIVWQGKLRTLVVPDAYLSLDPQVLADIINATVINAFIACEQDRKRLIEAGGSNLSPV